MDFKERCFLLEKFGIEYRLADEYRKAEDGGREPHDLEIFSQVRLDFMPEEWCEIMMSDGEYHVGGCCGTMSAVQSIIDGIFRDSGWVNCTDLEQIATYFKNHDCDDNSIWNDPNNFDWDGCDPWEKISTIWNIVQTCYDKSAPTAAANHDVTDINHSMFVLYSGIRALSLDKFFVKVESSEQEKANRAMMLSRILPALKIVWEKIGELDLGPVEGVALVDKEQGPEAICHNGYGYCIYSEKEANEMLELWRKNDRQYKDKERHKSVDERIIVRKVRVSKEKGIEFLD